MTEQNFNTADVEDLEELDELDGMDLSDLSMDELRQMMPGFMGGLAKPGKYMTDRYYRGETKKLRRRKKVLAARKAVKAARKLSRGRVKGQSVRKGQRNRFGKT